MTTMIDRIRAKIAGERSRKEGSQPHYHLEDGTPATANEVWLEGARRNQSSNPHDPNTREHQLWASGRRNLETRSTA